MIYYRVLPFHEATFFYQRYGARHVPPSGERKEPVFYEITATDGSTIRRVRCRLLDRLGARGGIIRSLSFLAMHCNAIWMFYTYHLINKI